MAESITNSLFDEQGYENLAMVTGLNLLQEATTLKTLSVQELNFDGAQEIDIATLSSLGVQVSIDNLTIQTIISTGALANLQSTGLSVDLVVSFQYVIDVADGGKMTLLVEAIFVQEVEFSISVSGGAVWKKAWIFPYISDYRLNADINVGVYTGIGLTGSVSLSNKSNFLQDAFDDVFGDGVETTDEWESGTAKLISIRESLQAMIEADNFFNMDEGELDDIESNYKDFLDKYSDDWVNVFTVSLLSQKSTVPGTLGVLAYGIDVDFVVSVRASVELGMAFEYSNAKSYIFSVSVFGKSATSETIDRITSNYQFNFYTIGTLGVRAGVKLTLRVGLFSVDFLSMGIQAEVGAYCQVWGYFYYRYAWTSGIGSSSYMGGALYLELGLYLDINFCASAVGFGASVPLMSAEYPLLTVGQSRVALDFTTSSEDFVPLAYFGAKDLTLPTYTKQMYYQDMVSGDLGSTSFATSLFTYQFSNPVFTWNESQQKVIVTPVGSQYEASTEMTITYNNALDLKGPMTRSFEIFWMDPESANVYSFESMGGSYVAIMAVGFDEEFIVPNDPTKIGYSFDGWYLDENYNYKYAFPTNSPSSKQVDLTLYAKWNPAPSPYTVEYYEQNLYGRYELVSSSIINENRSNSSVLSEGQPTAHSKTAPSGSGFSYVSSLQDCSHDFIQGDGSLLVKEYFSRNEYTIAFSSPETGYADLLYSYYYEGTVVIPNSLFYYAGYDFDGWTYGAGTPSNDDVAFVMPSQNLTFSANWTVADSYYQVEHYLQQANGTYVIAEMEQQYYDEDTEEYFTQLGNAVAYHTGKTGDSVASLDTLILDFDTYTYNKATGNGSTISYTLPTISGDNSTLIRLFYDRNMVEVTWNSDGGTLTDSTFVHEGAEITLPTQPTKTGYVFVEWQDQSGKAFVSGTTIGTESVTYKAIWSAGEGTEYKVKHVRQNLDFTYPDYGLLVEEDTFYGTTDSAVTPSAKQYDGFTAPTTTTHSIFADGSLVIVYEYSRNTYQISYNLTGGDDMLNPVSSYLYGEGTNLLPAPSKLGYVFSHWTLDGTQISAISETEFGDVTLVAVWSPDGNTAYQVEHYSENLSGGGYTLAKTTDHTGETDSSVTASQENITGFTFDEANSSHITTGIVLPDGTLVLKLYYSRNSYEVAWYDYDTTSLLKTDSYQFEASISAPSEIPTRTGYTFDGWEHFATTMGTADLSYNGKDHGTWTANTYTINYDLQNGTLSETAPTSYVYEEGTALEEATRAGYTFQYWTLSNTTDQVTAITTTDIGDISLVANWAVAGDTPYKVEHYTQNLNGTYTVHSSTEHTGQTEDTATASQIAITGFSYNSDHTDKLESAAIVGDGSLVLKLYYSRNSYTVLWKDYSGTTLESVTYLYEQDIVTTSEPPIREGYTFDAWTGIAEKMGTDNLEYSAKENANGTWIANTYTITYNTDGGALDPGFITSYTYGIGVDLPVPTKAGYTFENWSDGENLIKVLTIADIGDKSLTANWQANTGTAYTIEHYVKDLGAITYTKHETQTPTGTTDTTVTANPNTYTGFDYDSNISGTVASGQIAGDGSLVLKLYYSRNSYDVTWYDYDKFNTLGTSFHEYQSSITPPNTLTTASRTGYTFASWNVSATMATKAQIFNAQDNGTWTENTYTIKFNANGGTGSMSDLSMSYDTAKNLTANSFTRTGYSFSGWSTTENGGMVYANSASVSQLTSTANGTVNLYAVWSAESYTITYDMGGKGTVDDVQFPKTYSVESGSITLPTNYIYISGLYRFTGWTASSGSVAKSGDDYTFTPSNSGGNVTLTAQWEEYFEITTNLTGQSAELTTASAGDIITVSPSEGMYLTAVTVTNASTAAAYYSASRPTVDSFSFTMPSYSVVVTATQVTDCDPTFNLASFKTAVPNTATKVTFTTSAPAGGISITDISEDGNGGVLVWNTGTEYTVGVGNVGKTIVAPSSLREMVYGYESLKEADLNALDTSNVTTLYRTFGYCQNLTELKIGDWDTSKVTTLSGTFSYCKSLTELKIEDWDTSKVTTLETTFSICSSLTSLDIGDWNVDQVTDIRGTFIYCSSLTTLDLSKWYSTKIEDFTYAFNGCTSLTTLKMGYVRVNSFTYLAQMFEGCSALTELDISGFYASSSTTTPASYSSMFTDTPSGLTVYYSRNIIIKDSITNYFYDALLEPGKYNLGLTGTLVEKDYNYQG